MNEKIQIDEMIIFFISILPSIPSPMTHDT